LRECLLLQLKAFDPQTRWPTKSFRAFEASAIQSAEGSGPALSPALEIVKHSLEVIGNSIPGLAALQQDGAAVGRAGRLFSQSG